MSTDVLLQLVFMVGSAVTLSFGIARLILKQYAQQFEASQQLMRDTFLQIDRRLQRLEEAINNLSQTMLILQSLLEVRRRVSK